MSTHAVVRYGGWRMAGAAAGAGGAGGGAPAAGQAARVLGRVTDGRGKPGARRRRWCWWRRTAGRRGAAGRCRGETGGFQFAAVAARASTRCARARRGAASGCITVELAPARLVSQVVARLRRPRRARRARRDRGGRPRSERRGRARGWGMRASQIRNCNWIRFWIRDRYDRRTMSAMADCVSTASSVDVVNGRGTDRHGEGSGTTMSEQHGAEPVHPLPARPVRAAQPRGHGADDAQPRGRGERAHAADGRVLRPARVGAGLHRHRGDAGVAAGRGLSRHARHPHRRAGGGVAPGDGRGARAGRPHLPAAVARGAGVAPVAAAGRRAAGGAVGHRHRGAELYTAQGMQPYVTPRALETDEIAGRGRAVRGRARGGRTRGRLRRGGAARRQRLPDRPVPARRHQPPHRRATAARVENRVALPARGDGGGGGRVGRRARGRAAVAARPVQRHARLATRAATFSARGAARSTASGWRTCTWWSRSARPAIRRGASPRCCGRSSAGR